MIIFYLNLNHVQIACHKATSQENVFNFKYDFVLWNRDIISFMSTVEDTRTKSICLLRILGKCIVYQLRYEILDIIMKIWQFVTPIMMIIFFNMLSQQQHINMQIRYSV